MSRETRFAGRTLFITGSTGIAAATAKLALLEGARVFVASRTAENGDTLKKSLDGFGEIAFAAADLTDEVQAENAVNDCMGRFGRIDACFNVAGISGRKFGDGPLHECTASGWDTTMDANVRSMFLVCRGVLRHMLQQSPNGRGLRGNILNMASVATHAYAASKGAIIGLSRSLAAYYAPLKIRVNVIAPALVRTPMSARAQGDETILRLMKTKQPLQEDLIEADDVARSALFLLSDDAVAITGDTLAVDGGWCVSG
jgi:NAD(P)-dependent dehydrogenase (short-subunit alcohol dehydrogenase family)